jgi:hypothetical protein
MSFQDREALLNEDVAMADLGQDLPDPAFDMLPPGEEGLFRSHAGGPEEMLDDLLNPYRLKTCVPLQSTTPGTHFGFSQRADLRTRQDRVEILGNSWQIQISYLVDAYLVWSESGAPCVVEGTGNLLAWEIMTIDLFGMYYVFSALFLLSHPLRLRNEKISTPGFDDVHKRNPCTLRLYWCFPRPT